MRKKMMGGGMMMQRPMYKKGGVSVGPKKRSEHMKKLKNKLEKKAKDRMGLKMGGSLKAVPADNKGLKKLPTEVRNKMGFMKDGGKVKTFKKAGFKDTLLQFKDLMTGSKDSKISKQKENLKKQILKNKNKEKNNGK